MYGGKHLKTKTKWQDVKIAQKVELKSTQKVKPFSTNHRNKIYLSDNKVK